MGLNFVMLFIVLFMLVSVRRIRRIIAKAKTSSRIQSNKFLLNLYIVLFVTELFILLTLQIVSMILGRADKAANIERYCKITLAFDFSYWMLWFNMIARTSITSYMNIKFSTSQ